MKEKTMQRTSYDKKRRNIKGKRSKTISSSIKKIMIKKIAVERDMEKRTHKNTNGNEETDKRRE